MKVQILVIPGHETDNFNNPPNDKLWETVSVEWLQVTVHNSDFPTNAHFFRPQLKIDAFTAQKWEKNFIFFLCVGWKNTMF